MTFNSKKLGNCLDVDVMMHKLKSDRQQLCSLQHCTTQTNP